MQLVAFLLLFRLALALLLSLTMSVQRALPSTRSSLRQQIAVTRRHKFKRRLPSQSQAHYRLLYRCSGPFALLLAISHVASIIVSG
jgi:hypothetical protein